MSCSGFCCRSAPSRRQRCRFRVHSPDGQGWQQHPGRSLCELPRAGAEKGGLDLSRRATALKGGKSGAAIVPGSPDDSLLVDKVADGEMPPKGALAREQVAAVRAWVEAGAPMPASRSGRAGPGPTGGRCGRSGRFRPRRGTGKITHEPGPATPIDAFILAALEANGLKLAPAADPGDLDPPRHV